PKDAGRPTDRHDPLANRDRTEMAGMARRCQQPDPSALLTALAARSVLVVGGCWLAAPPHAARPDDPDRHRSALSAARRRARCLPARRQDPSKIVDCGAPRR